jgi:hypothetical protein
VQAHEVRITNYSDNFVVVKIVIQISGGQSDGSESSVPENAQESQLLVRLLQHSIHRDLMKSRSQISSQLDAVQKSIGTP